MASNPEQAKAFLRYLQENKKDRDLLQKALETILVAAGALKGFHFEPHDLAVETPSDIVIDTIWHVNPVD